MPQATYRSWIGVAKDTVNANLTSAIISGATSLPITNLVGTTGTLTTSGSTYSAIIVDGVNTETVACTGNLSAGAIACGATTYAHAANVYVYFQLTASIGPTAYIPVTKLDWQDTYVQLYDQGFRGSNVKNFAAVQGVRSAKLAIDGDLFADTFGYLLGSAFGAYDYTATSGGNPTTYAFSPANTASSNGQPPGYLFYDYNPGNSNTRVLAHAIVTDLTVKADPGALLNYSATITAFASGVVANPSTIPPAYSSFGVIPARVATVSIGGTATPKVKTYELSLKREEAGEIFTLQGIQDPLTIFVGPLVATVKSTLIVDDDVQLANYINASQPSFTLTATQGATTAVNGIKVQNSKANYEQVKVVQSAGYVTLEVPFTALANSTDKSTAGGGLSPVLITLSTGTTTGATLY